jgi:hypothetical protein
MPNYVERFAWRGRDEETGDMVEFGVPDAITSGGAPRVGYIEEMELVGRLGLLEQRTHPSSCRIVLAWKSRTTETPARNKPTTCGASGARSLSQRSK